jgi:hypothetical protein
MSAGILLWKVQKLIDRIFQPGVRYIVSHANKETQVLVYVYDTKESKQVENRYNSCFNSPPRWWKKDMCDTSYIYVNAPDNYAKLQGITFESRIADAYKQLQVIADAMNQEIIDRRERQLEANKASEIAKKDAASAAKNFSSKKV